MLECMKYARSWVCAAGCLPKPVHNKARGKLQIYFPEILARGDKMDTYFSSEGRVQHVGFFYLFNKPQHQKRQHFSPLDNISSFLHCLLLAGWLRLKPELRDQILHCFFLISPHFSCARGRQEVSDLELPSAKEDG